MSLWPRAGGLTSSRTFLSCECRPQSRVGLLGGDRSDEVSSSLMWSRPRTTIGRCTRTVSWASYRGSRASLAADVSYATESTEPTNRCESSVLSILSPTRQSRFQSRVHVGSTRHRRPKQRDCRFGRFGLVCLPRLPRRAGCRPGRRPRLMVQRHQGHRRTSGGR